MSIETELKLRIAPEHLTRLRRHALLRKHQLGAPVTHRLYNVYYDTPGLDLHHNEMALRLRRVNGQWLQTLKGGGSVKAGLHQRHEWEVPVPSEKLDFSGLDEAVWDAHLTPEIRKNLAPLFITDFYRTSRHLDWQGATIEVCLDHGEVKAGELCTPICELELELKSGHPQQLFELALRLLEIVPFELESVSKAEQGFRLLAGFAAMPVKGIVPKLSESDSLTDSLQSLIWSCLQHFQGNLGGVTGKDVEYLHQMRVALRRLRVVLRMAEKLHADNELASMREALALLGSNLGRIREWDVFIAQTLKPALDLIEGNAGRQGMQALLALSGQQRTACYTEFLGAVQARELQRFLLRVSIWMNGPYWQQAAQHAPNTLVFSTKRLRQLARRFAKSGQNLHTLDATQLHALRIQTKKLRYSGEFFASLYDSRKVKNYLNVLSEVQELLGKMNDMTVARQLLDELARSLPLHRQVVAFIKGGTYEEFNLKFKLLKKSIQKIDKQPGFWEA